MKKISLSLVLIKENYFKKFENYTILNLKKNLDQIKKGDLCLTFLICTEKSYYLRIENLFTKYFYNFNYQIIFDSKKINSDEITYKFITEIQKKHIIISKEKKFDFIIFIYSDLLYSINTLKNSIKILISKKKFSAISSFGLSLNDNKFFKIFFLKLINNKNYLNYLINESKNLISNFHKTFHYKENFFSNSNFIYILKKNGIFIKSKHYHPIVIRVSRIKNTNFETLDSQTSKMFKKQSEIYVESNMKKISIFSFDSKHLSRNKFNFNNIVKKKNQTLYKKLSLLNIRYNINPDFFFLNNYLSFSFSKYLKVKSLNNFINYFFKLSNLEIKEKIIKNENEISFFLKEIKNIKVLLLLKYLIKTKIQGNSKLLRYIFSRFISVGLINKPKKNYTVCYKSKIIFLLLKLYSIRDSIKFLINQRYSK